MQTIILGKEGNQPFEIKADGVSRQHARITICDVGDWILEDMNSSNGTYIRNETDGELVRVVKTSVTPMTFICLGPDNAKGCSFYARQVLKENVGRYNREYEYMIEKENEFDQQIDQLEKTIKNKKILVLIINIAVVLLSLFPNISSEIRMNMLRVVPVISAGFAVFYDANSKKKQIRAMREKFHHCPNPQCSHKLKESEVREMKCGKCKK